MLNSGMYRGWNTLQNYVGGSGPYGDPNIGPDKGLEKRTRKMRIDKKELRERFVFIPYYLIDISSA